MAALSNFAEQSILNHILGKIAYTMPTVSVALYTVAPNDVSGGTEVTGGGYTRLATSGSDWDVDIFGATNTVDFEWPTASANWGTIVAAALVDGAGNILVYGTAASPKTIENGDTYRIPAGSFSLTMD